jgi:hypothetical protein
MVLDDHHWDVVELYRVGKGDEPTLGGMDHGRLVVVDPVTDVFDTGGSEQFGGFQGLRKTRAEPADRSRASKAFYNRE